MHSIVPNIFVNACGFKIAYINANLLAKISVSVISNLVNRIHGTIPFLLHVLSDRVSKSDANANRKVVTRRDSDHLETENGYKHRKCYLTIINHLQSEATSLN